MKKSLFLEKNSLIQKMIGIFFLFSGILSLIIINITLGPAFLMIWISLIIGGLTILYTDGLELDLNKNKYRVVFSIFGFNFGFWKTIKKIDSISIFKTNYSKTIGMKGFNSTATANLSEKVIKINLFTENEKPVTIYITKSEENAIEIAKKFKSHYGIEIINKLN